MRTELSIPYIDRSTGRSCRETVYADRFLDWSYNSRLGWAFTRLISSRPVASRIYGWVQRRSWSRRKIEPFVAKMRINCDELTRPINSFSSFAEFFGRRLDPACRPVDSDPLACVSPVDGKLLAYRIIAPGSTIQVKRHRFSLE